MIKTSKAAFPVLISVCLSASLSAQTSGAGTITGTITDPSGGVIPGGRGGRRRIRRRRRSGRSPRTRREYYVAQFLQPGAYEITVSKQGFAKTVRTGLTLQVGQTLTVNLALAVQTPPKR